MFLGRRLAAAEGEYFANRSREAIANLKKKQKDLAIGEKGGAAAAAAANENQNHQGNADVLPEILRHSIPFQGGEEQQQGESRLTPPSPVDKFTGSAWKDSDRDYSLPIGPRAWAYAREPVYRYASTANDTRTDTPGLSSQQTKLIIEGYLMIVKAFVVASTIVFGGAVLGVKWITTSLEIQSLEDIPIKGREAIQPKVEGLREMLQPVRSKIHSLRDRVHKRGDLIPESLEEQGQEEQQQQIQQ